MPSRPKLREIVAALEKLYGKPAPFPSNDPWELILRENASYLVDDATREEVFRSLKATRTACAFSCGPGMRRTMRTTRRRTGPPPRPWGRSFRTARRGSSRRTSS
jgi:hypothetical protein